MTRTACLVFVLLIPVTVAAGLNDHVVTVESRELLEALQVHEIDIPHKTRSLDTLRESLHQNDPLITVDYKLLEPRDADWWALCTERLLEHAHRLKLDAESLETVFTMIAAEQSDTIDQEILIPHKVFLAHLGELPLWIVDCHRASRTQTGAVVLTPFYAVFTYTQEGAALEPPGLCR